MAKAPKKQELDGSATMRHFAHRQIASRLAGLSERAGNAAAASDAESIHDLRVAIRRLSQALSLFSGLVRKKELKKIRKRLKDVMSLTSQVRNRDIALEHLADADAATMKERLQTERSNHARQVRETVAKWHQRDFAKRWTASLELDPK